MLFSKGQQSILQSLEIIVSFSYFVNLCHYIIPPFCAEKGTDPDDIYMQTIKAAQFSEEDFFGTAINKDMVKILSSIRDAHRHDSTTADTTGADVVKNALEQANHFKWSAKEAQVAMFLKQLGIKYSKLTKDEFVTLMGILRKSDMLKSPGSKRSKGNRKKQ